jgi:hypothetical protein
MLCAFSPIKIEEKMAILSQNILAENNDHNVSLEENRQIFLQIIGENRRK